MKPKDASVNERSMYDFAADPLTTSVRQNRGSFISTAILLFIYAMIVVGSPYLLMQFFNHIMDGAPSLAPQALVRSVTDLGLGATEAEAVIYATALLILGSVGAWLSRLEETAPLACALSTVSSWRRIVLYQLLHGRLAFFETHSAHELASRVSDDGLIVESLLISSLKASSKSLPILIFMLIALAIHSPLLAFAFGIATTSFYALAASFVRADWVRSKRSDLETGHYRNEIQHSLLMLPSLKSLSVEDEALDQLALRSERADEQALLSRRARGSLAATVTSAKHLLRATLVVFGAWLIVNHGFMLGPFLLFVIYTELMPAAVIELARCVALARTAAPALERLRGLAASLANSEEVEGSRKTSSLPFPDAGVLSFVDVAFKPHGSRFSADFEPGELIAVVGDGGRSTFGRWLNRLNDPATGQIQIGRTQLKSYSLDLLRQTVTLVDRHPYFMTASVRENLALAIERDTDLDDRSVNEALSAAGADFVSALPEKLDTIIGEAAYRLSESETLRLGVARAFLRSDSRVFFFDEVTEGLEATEARVIFEAVQRLAERGALVFWVTRRADEASDCDRIVLLEQSVLESGQLDIRTTVETPDALILSSQNYRKILGVRDVRLNPAGSAAPSPPRSPARGRGTEMTL